MAKKELWELVERYNPQLGTYWIRHGKVDHKASGETLYGSNTYHYYDSEATYLAAIEEVEKTGARVQ